VPVFERCDTPLQFRQDILCTAGEHDDIGPAKQVLQIRRVERSASQMLDMGGEALDASFPASDPVSIVTSNEEEDWGTEPRIPENKKTGA